MRYLPTFLLLLPFTIDAAQVGRTVTTSDGSHGVDTYARWNGFNQPEAGTLDSLVVYVVSSGGLHDMKLGLFSSTGDCGADSTACNPNAQIDITAAFTPSNDAWNQQAVLTGVSLTANTMYWIGCIAEGDDPMIPYKNNVYGDDPYENDNNGWSWPNFNDPAVPDNSTSHRTYSWYWVYTATGAAAYTPAIMITGED